MRPFFPPQVQHVQTDHLLLLMIVGFLFTTTTEATTTTNFTFCPRSMVTRNNNFFFFPASPMHGRRKILLFFHAVSKACLPHSSHFPAGLACLRARSFSSLLALGRDPMQDIFFGTLMSPRTNTRALERTHALRESSVDAETSNATGGEIFQKERKRVMLLEKQQKKVDKNK